MHSHDSTRRIPHGGPAFADTQRQEVLKMLQAAGQEGVSRATFIFEKHITQCGARVDELKRQGYFVQSELPEGEKYVRYVLKSEPLDLTRLPWANWYTKATGNSRQMELEGPGPLFDRKVSR